MAGKFKIYSLADIMNILDDKFIVYNVSAEYTTKDTLNVECKICGAKSTKKIKNKLSSKCRNCSMKEAYKRKLEEKFFSYKNVYDYHMSRSGYVVKFVCEKCSERKEKLFNNFKNNQLCTNCSVSESAIKKYGDFKKEKFVKLMKDHKINYEDFKFDSVYDNIEIQCQTCSKYVTEKIYRVRNFLNDKSKFVCRSCTKKNKIKNSTYNLVKFYKNNKELGNQYGYLYMYTIIVNGVESYKLGITRGSIQGRIRKVLKKYNISNIMFIKMTNLEAATFERELKKKYRDYKIIPDIKFEGYTECFTKPILLLENMKVQRLSLSGSTSQANGDGSGQPL